MTFSHNNENTFQLFHEVEVENMSDMLEGRGYLIEPVLEIYVSTVYYIIWIPSREKDTMLS